MRERVGVVLQETGKICITDDSPDYAFENSEGVLVWDNNGKNEPVMLYLITDAVWQPYHEVKEIRPEAGELWISKVGDRYFITSCPTVDYLTAVARSGNKYTLNKDYSFMEYKEVVHNKNGWTRLFPEPEDDSVERIEIEGVVCKEDSECVYTIETTFTAPQDLANKPMKMILVMEKDKP